MKTMDLSSKPAAFSKTTNYSSHLLFDPVGKQILSGLTIATCNPNVNISAQQIKETAENAKSDIDLDLEAQPVVADCMVCNCCQAHFADREEQLGHYKCDWHRYNLHRRLKGLPCVSEEEFEEAAGDVSSISGSDDEDDDDDDDDAVNTLNIFEKDTQFTETNDTESEERLVFAERKFYKVFFKTKEGELISLFRCLLHHKKCPLYEPDSILSAVNDLQEKKVWIILMVSSGHFAGSVFNGNQVVDHKTFHRYTVRAGRGTAQSTKDAHGGAPKSAGSTLRRYNEAALVQDVQDLLSKWEDHINNCHLVFIRVPVANRAMFFGGKNPAFKKDDPRIRVIPLATRRPTFSETKRVHQMLASVECYGKAAELKDIVPLSPPRMYDGETGQLILRTGSPGVKHAKAINKRLRAQQPDALDTSSQANDDIVEDGQCQDNEIEMDLVETLEEIDFSELKPYDSTVKKRNKRKKPTTEKQNLAKDNNLDKEVVQSRNALYTACKIGCLDSVQDFLVKFGSELSHISMKSSKDTCEDLQVQHSLNSEDKNSCVNEISNSDLAPSLHDSVKENHCNPQTDSVIDTTDSTKTTSSQLSSLESFLNMPLGDDGLTFLHVAAKEGHAEVVNSLLSSGADPAIKNKDGKTPYNLGESEVRNTFRRFMAQFPERYDYSKAQIPSPLTAEMEAEKKQKAAEKRKAKKKAMQEQRKDKKATDEKIKQENQEKDRFLALSEREKRALAAEKRILQQCNDKGLSKPVLSRCWQCGTDITGNVPFEYFDYKFCTTKCLREHRSKSSASK